MVTAEVLSPRKRPISVYYILGKHRFELAFSAGEEARIKVQYRQQAPVKDAYYMLTTTKPWRHPLIQGTYRLMQRGVQVISSNYLLRPNKEGMLIFQKNNFMPEKDWHFTWEVI